MINLDKNLAWCSGGKGCECLRCRVRVLTKKGVNKGKAVVAIASQLGITKVVAMRYLMFAQTIGKHRG